jgi:hypothetical protein
LNQQVLNTTSSWPAAPSTNPGTGITCWGLAAADHEHATALKPHATRRRVVVAPPKGHQRQEQLFEINDGGFGSAFSTEWASSNRRHFICWKVLPTHAVEGQFTSLIDFARAIEQVSR